MRTAVALALAAIAGAIAAAVAGTAQAGCGADPAPCAIAGGTYHAVLPPGDGPHPAVVFIHGFGASGEGTMTNTGMVDALIARGHAVIAPDGQMRTNGQGRSWDFRMDRPATRDEVAFLRAVADDAATRLGLARDRMLLAGFSVGGSMATYVACADPGAFRAYAPVAGSFWRPQPTGCAGPADLFHLHGWTDGTVPLEGRALRSGIAQGDVFAAMALWRDTGGCPLNPDSHATRGDTQVRSWTTCTSGRRIDFALHPGGHGIPPGWADMALDWFTALP
jgi:polyhydroxybutyrate depolymerase